MIAVLWCLLMAAALEMDRTPKESRAWIASKLAADSLRAPVEPRRVLRVSVVDQEGAPLSGATATLNGLRTSVVTDPSGRARIDEAPAGLVRLRVQSPRYDDAETTIVVPAGDSESVTITMTRAHASMETTAAGNGDVTVMARTARQRRSVAGLQVYAMDPLGRIEKAVTDSWGRAAFEDLPIGRIRIWSPDTLGYRAARDSIWLEVGAAEVVTLLVPARPAPARPRKRGR